MVSGEGIRPICGHARRTSSGGSEPLNLSSNLAPKSIYKASIPGFTPSTKDK